MSDRPKYSTDPKLNAALEEDARKLEALGGDPGITLDNPRSSPAEGLDFEGAYRRAGLRLPDSYPVVADNLNAQLRLIMARVRAETRRETLIEVKAEMQRRVNADPLTRYIQVLAWLDSHLQVSP